MSYNKAFFLILNQFIFFFVFWEIFVTGRLLTQIFFQPFVVFLNIFFQIIFFKFLFCNFLSIVFFKHFISCLFFIFFFNIFLIIFILFSIFFKNYFFENCFKYFFWFFFVIYFLTYFLIFFKIYFSELFNTPLTLFRIGGAKNFSPISFFPVTSTNVRISPKNVLTFRFNPFDRLV